MASEKNVFSTCVPKKTRPVGENFHGFRNVGSVEQKFFDDVTEYTLCWGQSRGTENPIHPRQPSTTKIPRGARATSTHPTQQAWTVEAEIILQIKRTVYFVLCFPAPDAPSPLAGKTKSSRRSYLEPPCRLKLPLFLRRRCAPDGVRHTV